MRPHVPATLTVLGALVAGCGDAAPTVTAPVEQVVATPTAVPTSAGPVPVTLRHFPAGLAVIGLDPSAKQLTIEIKVAGLTAGGTHPAQLMSGSCAHPGALLHPLDPLVIADNSIADVRTTVNGVKETEIPATGWSLAVYRGTAAADRLAMIMCGELVNEVRQAVITAGISVVVPPGGPDPNAKGTATLSIVNGQLKVVLDATGLTPGSTHSAQIRRGNCEGEKGIVHPLGTLTADATGHAVITSLVPGVTSVPLNTWFVSLSAPAVLDPVVCGNVGT